MNDYGLLASTAAKKYGLPDGLLEAVITAESNWNPKARSSAGALGIAQIMPPTAKDLGIDPLDPVQAIDGAARHLARLNKKFGNLDNTIAAYNAGEGNVQKYGGIPPFKETQNYVPKVKANMQKPEKIDLSTVKWDDEPIDLSSVKWDDEPAKSAEPSPTDGNSFLGNLTAGIVSGMTDLALGAKQRFDEGAAALEKKFGGQKLGAALGMPSAENVLANTQNKIVEKRKMDAPLLATAGGKAGNITSKVAPAIGAALLPGGQGLAGSLLAGSGLGFAEPTIEGESVAKNTLWGGVGGVTGYGVGKGIQAGANKIASNTAAKQTENALRDTMLSEAAKKGLVVPPTMANPTFTNKLLEGFGGKIATSQSASIKNQPAFNRMAAKELGLDPAEPVTIEALTGLRSQAGEAYNTLSQVGKFKTDWPFRISARKLDESNKLLAKDFPEMANKEISELAEAFKKPEFDSASTIEALKTLRFEGGANKISLDPKKKALGRVQLQAAKSLEDLIERNLVKTKQPELLKEFKSARELIAKTYSVEKALNSATWNVSPTALAKQLKKGKPLSGELKMMAEFGQMFPTASREITSSMPGVSPLDYAAGGMMSAAHGNVMPLLAQLTGRPAARSLLLSKPYQKGMMPNYNTPLSGLLGTNQARIGLQGTTTGLLSPEFFQQ